MPSIDLLLKILAGVKEVVVILAAATGASVAVYGLQTWRRQLVGVAEWDLARRLLRRVYAVRDGLNQMRGIFMSGAELEDALKKTGLDHLQGKEREAAALGAGYQVRWERVRTALSDLDVEVLEAEVLWGREVLTALEPLHKCAKELQVNLYMYLNYQRDRPRTPTAQEQLEKAEQVVFGMPDDSGRDQFAERLSASIATAESFIRPRIRAMVPPSKRKV